jgi:hypothetical protein
MFSFEMLNHHEGISLQWANEFSDFIKYWIIELIYTVKIIRCYVFMFDSFVMLNFCTSLQQYAAADQLTHTHIEQ